MTTGEPYKNSGKARVRTFPLQTVINFGNGERVIRIGISTHSLARLDFTRAERFDHLL